MKKSIFGIINIVIGITLIMFFYFSTNKNFFTKKVLPFISVKTLYIISISIYMVLGILVCLFLIFLFLDGFFKKDFFMKKYINLLKAIVAPIWHKLNPKKVENKSLLFLKEFRNLIYAFGLAIIIGLSMGNDFNDINMMFLWSCSYLIIKGMDLLGLILPKVKV